VATSNATSSLMIQAPRSHLAMAMTPVSLTVAGGQALFSAS